MRVAMYKAVIFGCTGYTGMELVRILSGHPDVRISAGSSMTWAGKSSGEVFPSWSSRSDFPLLNMKDLLNEPNADVAFLALPHGQSASAVRPLLDAGLKVVDLSADFRLRDANCYKQWYGEHPDPDLLGMGVYGLPELNREIIREARLIANPGCYPTTVILGIAPLLMIDYVDTSCPVVDSKSGISGAGRGAKLGTSFCETGEGFKPYGVIGHRHISEMEQELSALAGNSVKVRFTPHLIPVSRGMVSTIYLPLCKQVDSQSIRKVFEDYYRDEPFVRILGAGKFPDTIAVRGSNQCHISVEVDRRTDWLVVMAAIDNLVKGASGQAVQNMNLVLGLKETVGLECLPLFP
jgi:N-acetyl-gamma-glutamyl-phosphate reductase